MEVIYQIYPLSFLDTNGDGIGDINGVIKKLPYLKELGVSYIWLTPIFKSPMKDNGYDISDYYQINKVFGSKDDLINLINKAKKHNINIMLDLVLNHTSNKHVWFKEAIKNKNSKYHDYYVWSNKLPKIQSFFGGSAWEYVESLDKYYLHLFAKEQPDLNWHNPNVRQELYKMINYYINLGIKGFRLDVLDLVGKVVTDKGIDFHKHLDEYLLELYEECFKDKGILTVGEMNLPLEKAHQLSSDKILSMVFQFDHVALDEVKGKGKWELKELDLNDLKDKFEKVQLKYEDSGIPALFWSNHDQPRALGRYLNLEYRYYAQTMLQTLLYLQKGNVFIYQGEEFGMSGLGKVEIDKYKDIEAINYYNEAILTKDKDTVLRSLEVKARDHSRTPMQWDNSINAGFTKGKPWLMTNPNYTYVNASTDIKSENSIYMYLKKLLQIKKNNQTLIKGKYKRIELGPNIYSYERILDDKYLIICNFTDDNININLPKGKIIISNYQHKTNKLRPYEALLMKRDD